MWHICTDKGNGNGRKRLIAAVLAIGNIAKASLFDMMSLPYELYFRESGVIFVRLLSKCDQIHLSLGKGKVHSVTYAPR
jgi:hypothetical protein